MTQLFCFDPDGNGIELANFPAAFPPFEAGEPCDVSADIELGDAAMTPSAQGSVGVISMNHRALECRAWEAASGFYKDVLGLRPHARPRFQWGGEWLYLPPCYMLHTQEGAEGANLREGPWSSRAVGDDSVDWANEAEGHHLCLSVDSIEDFKGRLETRGVAHAVVDGQFIFMDTEGNCIVLHSRTGL